MKRYVISSLLVLVGVVNAIASVHGDHGRAYELNGGSSLGDSAMWLFIIFLAGAFLYVLIFGGKDKKS